MSVRRGILVRRDDGALHVRPEVFCYQCTVDKGEESRHEPPECARKAKPEPPLLRDARVWATTGDATSS